MRNRRSLVLFESSPIEWGLRFASNTQRQNAGAGTFWGCFQVPNMTSDIAVVPCCDWLKLAPGISESLSLKMGGERRKRRGEKGKRKKKGKGGKGRKGIPWFLSTLAILSGEVFTVDSMNGDCESQRYTNGQSP